MGKKQNFGKCVYQIESNFILIKKIYYRFIYLKERPANIRAKWYDIEGKITQEELNQSWTRIFLHEIDHLRGNKFFEEFIRKDELRILKDKNTCEIWLKENKKYLLP